MAILRSRDGKFYDIPDGELESMEVPAERLKEVLGDMGPEGEAGGGVEPYGWGFRIAAGVGATIGAIAGGTAGVTVTDNFYLERSGDRGCLTGRPRFLFGAGISGDCPHSLIRSRVSAGCASQRCRAVSCPKENAPPRERVSKSRMTCRIAPAGIA